MFDYSMTPADQRGITIYYNHSSLGPGPGDSQVQELNNPQTPCGSAGTAIFLMVILHLKILRMSSQGDIE
jgi:hypothetical protein